MRRLLNGRQARRLRRRTALAAEQLRSDAVYNPFARTFRACPFTTYQELRERDPVHWSRLLDRWIVTRYDDLSELLHDRRFASRATLRRKRSSPLAQIVNRSPLRLDAPDHARIKSFLNRGFTPARADAARPALGALAARLAEGLPRGEPCDLMAEFVSPFVRGAMAEFLGIPEARRASFVGWSGAVAPALDPIRGGKTLRRANEAAPELIACLRQLVEERLGTPGEDLISELVHTPEAAALTPEEMAYALAFLLVGGTDTTIALITGTVQQLLMNPDQLALVRADAGLVANAVEEGARVSSPVHLSDRRALEDVTFRGRKIRRGQKVLTGFLAANTDPLRFPDPLRFDVTRGDSRHLAFGQGPHYCLGAPVARVEAAVAVGALLTRYPDIRLATDRVAYDRTVVVRLPASLPVVIAEGG